jgi:hypothetical protein
MRTVFEKKFPSLCFFFFNKGYKFKGKQTRPRHEIAHTWLEKPYGCLLPFLSVFEDYFSVLNENESNNDFHLDLCLIHLTNILDALTLKPSVGFKGRANNSNIGKG